MAFPTTPTVAAGRALTAVQADTTATRTFPSLSGLTKNAGDLLIAICVAYQTSTGTNAAFSGWTGGFTEFHDSATSTTLAIGCAYKWSDGTETGTFAVTQAGTITGQAAFILLSIPGAHDSTPPEAGGRHSGINTTLADPTSFNPSGWDVEDTLWIAVGGDGEISGTGSYTGLSASPTNYSGDVKTGISQDTVGGVEALVGFRELAAASEDPGTFTADTSNSRHGGIVIAVRPAAGVTPIDLVVADLTVTVVADSPTLTQVHGLTVADLTVTVAAEAPALTQVHQLAVSDLTVASAIDAVTLELGAVDLVVADLNVTVAADTPTLTQVHNLVVADLTVAVAADAPVLTQVHQLTVADLTVATTVESVALTQVHTLAVADVTTATTIDGVTITVGGIDLTVADLTIASTVDAVALTQVHELTVADLAVTAAVGAVALTQAHQLEVAGLAVAVAIDTVTLTSFSAIPALLRVYEVATETRTLTVDAEARTVTVRTEPRTVTVRAEPRTHAAEAESRTLEVR